MGSFSATLQAMSYLKRNILFVLAVISVLVAGGSGAFYASEKSAELRLRANPLSPAPLILPDTARKTELPAITTCKGKYCLNLRPSR